MRLIGIGALAVLSACAYVKQDAYNQDIASGRFSAPPGTVSAFAGDTIPVGWLSCDGQSYKKADHPALYAAIKDTYGTDSADASVFFVPDYRGLFLRGVDGSSGRDPDAASRASMHGGAAAGDHVGTVEPDGFQEHGHTEDSPGHSHSATVNRNNINGTNATHDGSTGKIKWNTDPNYGSLTVSIGNTVVTTKSVVDTTAGAARHGKETRPKNASVQWIIKT